MGPIYQLSQEEEKILDQYLKKMIKKGKIRPSSSSVGSLILFVPIPNGKGLLLWVNCRHLNDHMKKNKTPLPIIDKLCQKLRDCDNIPIVNMMARFHLITMALRHKTFTAFQTKFGLYEYMVMLFGLTNAPAIFQGEINQGLQQFLCME
jgi:hypothetical protein